MESPVEPGNRSQRRQKAKAKKRSFILEFQQIDSKTVKVDVKQLISLIIGENNDDKPAIVADMSWQSRVRWPLENMQSYITSLIIGMAPSKYIFASTGSCVDVALTEKDRKYYQSWIKKKVRYLNVDSNNRVTTIQKFINNEFGIQPGIYTLQNGQVVEVAEGENDTFDKLDDVLRNAFLFAPITLEVIQGANRKQLSDQFIRMNDGITLNGPEKRNAVLSDFSEQIRDLTTDQLKNIGTYFREKEIGRRKADDFLAGLCLLWIHGPDYSISEKVLWEAYKEDSTANKVVFAFVSKFKEFIKAFKPFISIIPNKNCIIDMMCIIKDMESQGRFLQDKKGFFTEFSRVHALLLKDNKFHKVSATKIVQYKELLRSREAKYNSIRRVLLEGGGEYQLGDKKNSIEEYYPTDKEAIFNYEQFFSVVRDPRRTFSKEEKLVAAWEQDWKTPEGKTIEFDDLLNTDKIQGGHDKPWADGGSTTQDNLKLQTKEDNQKLGKNPITDSEEPVE